jgi:hypothetical protein
MPAQRSSRKMRNRFTMFLVMVSLLAAVPAVAADDFELEEGFKSLFNGKDLAGWSYRARKTLAVDESFDGQTQASDGRFVVTDGVLVSNPRAHGEKRARLWTVQQFPNDFVLKFEFRASPDADSGVYLRKPQLQVRDYGSAGPYRELKSYRAQRWNEIVVEVKGGVAKATCNGELIEEAIELPADGPLGIESDRGTVEYRRIRLKELS